MKTIVAVLTLVIATAAQAEPTKARLDRVVAVVDDAVILQSELDARHALVPKTPVREVLDEMIDEELIVQAAIAAKVTVTSREVEQSLDEIANQNNLSRQDLVRLLAAHGYTIVKYKAELNRQLLRLRAINTLVAPTAKGDVPKATKIWVGELRKHARIEIRPSR